MVAHASPVVQPPDTSREEAERFIAALTGDPFTPVTWQTFPDGDDSSTAPCWIHAPVAEAWDRLLDLQEYGHGIFWMVNEGDGLGRSGANVQRLRALFVDDDSGRLEPANLPLTPTVVVDSGHGRHCYWRLVPGEPLRLFSPAQQSLAARLGTDPKVKDLPRVMRVPGTFNLKDRMHPRPVRLLSASTATPPLPVADILLDLGAEIEQPANVRGPAAAGPLRPLSLVTVERARAYLAAIHAVQGEGGDVTTFKVAANLLRDFGLDPRVAWELLREWNRTNAVPPWPEKDLAKKFQSAARYGKAPIGKKLADQLHGADGDSLDRLAANNVRLDPANWVSDLSSSRPWRNYRANVWTDGISDTAMRRLLSNEGGMGLRAAENWMRRVAVVDYAGPVYSTKERIVTLPDGARVANTFRPPILVPQAGDWRPIERVLRNLTGGDEAAYRWLVGWVGKVAQSVYAGRPARIGVAPVFTGPKGSGKGTLEEVCKSLLGRWNVVGITQADLDTVHNSWLDGVLLVFANEVWTSDHRGAAQLAKLKDAITCHERVINRKNQPQYVRTAVENWIFAANNFRPVEVERGDRRFTVFRTGGPIGPELGSLVADDARADGPLARAFLAYLLQLPPEALVSDYRPLETEAKQTVLRASGNSATKFAQEIVERGFFSVTPPQAIPGDLYLWGSEGARSIETLQGTIPVTICPLITRRRLMEVYRSYCQEISAPAQQETALLAALREEIPGLVEREVLLDGRREKVLGGFPGMLPERITVTVGPPEPTGPEQATLL